MEVKQYIDKKKDFYDQFLTFIMNSNDDIIDYLKSNDCLQNPEELIHFLFLILNISNNHHRQSILFKNIFKILEFLSKDIKQTLSNQEIFDIFKSNKLILLYLFENNIISFDNYVIQYITFSFEAQKNQLYQFFQPEMANNIEKHNENEINLTDFKENRKIGENESYICKLIRNDSVEEFISYVNKQNISLSNSIIKPSIFETNLFLIQKKPTLIEYAAFYGSIKIFQFLKMNGVELTESLWLYAIHSNNAELIQILIDNRIKPDDDSFEECLLESIKCHHNEFANYIEMNLLNENAENSKLKENIICYSVRYSNYEYFPYELDQNFAFFYLVQYNYSTLVHSLLKTKEKSLEIIKIYLLVIFLIQFQLKKF